ncbi:hypothetical protein B0H12DRAFT_1216382 [Mycena haematopus]|nr:hypothetical protein B0H12DRAFT_1221135 [Mycena haematopus]KAJ7268702.1 hypothetical protein B0H12DRAFT_1216382 [Mycena haematopus]
MHLPSSPSLWKPVTLVVACRTKQKAKQLAQGTRMGILPGPDEGGKGRGARTNAKTVQAEPPAAETLTPDSPDTVPAHSPDPMPPPIRTTFQHIVSAIQTPLDIEV